MVRLHHVSFRFRSSVNVLNLIDAIGSVAFNPMQRTLLTVSGSRHFHHADTDISDESDSEGEEDGVDTGAEGRQNHRFVTRAKARPSPIILDSSIKIWSFEGNET